MILKENYALAKCCGPSRGDPIVGYYSHTNIIKVHKQGCSSLSMIEPERTMVLSWDEITAEPPPTAGDDIKDLDDVDFRIMMHHDSVGVDYSLKVAAILHLDRRTVFDRHAKLRDMGLLARVEPRIIQYRKNIVRGKWIKHRNHTYYDLTDKGRLYLSYRRDSK